MNKFVQSFSSSFITCWRSVQELIAFWSANIHGKLQQNSVGTGEKVYMDIVDISNLTCYFEYFRIFCANLDKSP